MRVLNWLLPSRRKRIAAVTEALDPYGLDADIIDKVFTPVARQLGITPTEAYQRWLTEGIDGLRPPIP